MQEQITVRLPADLGRALRRVSRQLRRNNSDVVRNTSSRCSAVAGELLLDTGALVSLLDRSQTHHLDCRRFFEAWDGAVVSTEAVLTEAAYLLADVRGGTVSCVDFFLTGGAVLVPTTPTSLKRVRALLAKYADLPMDFATRPSWPWERTSIRRFVFTTDRTDFSVYRLKSRKPFHIVPE